MKKPRTWVLNFKAYHADAVRSLAKMQTIRAHRKDGARFEIGDTLRAYTGLRTKSTQLLGTFKIVDVFDVSIALFKNDAGPIRVGGSWLTPENEQTFARLDGFEDAEHMKRWFRVNHGAHRESFSGTGIRWEVMP